MTPKNEAPVGRIPDVTQSPTGEKPSDLSREAPESPTERKSWFERVREAAYRKFEERGSVHGNHEDDWSEAEKEVGPNPD
jgi:hypothetical protein